MLIGICGGIGSGKSVVSRLLRNLGYNVIDCDLEARLLMNRSEDIKRAICNRISSEVTDGVSIPDRKKLADIVFNNEDARLMLNEIVHSALRERIREIGRVSGDEPLFVEAAILAESGLAEECRYIIKVEADREERLERVRERDAASDEHILARMRSQEKEERLLAQYSDRILTICNGDKDTLIMQVENLLKSI